MTNLCRPAHIRRWSFIVAAVVALQSLWLPLPHSVQAQADSRTFQQTGKTVAGSFLKYWDSHGGLAQQGYPISDEKSCGHPKPRQGSAPAPPYFHGSCEGFSSRAVYQTVRDESIGRWTTRVYSKSHKLRNEYQLAIVILSVAKNLKLYPQFNISRFFTLFRMTIAS